MKDLKVKVEGARAFISQIADPNEPKGLANEISTIMDICQTGGIVTTLNKATWQNTKKVNKIAVAEQFLADIEKQLDATPESLDIEDFTTKVNETEDAEALNTLRGEITAKVEELCNEGVEDIDASELFALIDAKIAKLTPVIVTPAKDPINNKSEVVIELPKEIADANVVILDYHAELLKLVKPIEPITSEKAIKLFNASEIEDIEDEFTQIFAGCLIGLKIYNNSRSKKYKSTIVELAELKTVLHLDAKLPENERWLKPEVKGIVENFESTIAENKKLSDFANSIKNQAVESVTVETVVDAIKQQTEFLTEVKVFDDIVAYFNAKQYMPIEGEMTAEQLKNGISTHKRILAVEKIAGSLEVAKNAAKIVQGLYKEGLLSINVYSIENALRKDGITNAETLSKVNNALKNAEVYIETRDLMLKNTVKPIEIADGKSKGGAVKTGKSEAGKISEAALKELNDAGEGNRLIYIEKDGNTFWKVDTEQPLKVVGKLFKEAGIPKFEKVEVSSAKGNYYSFDGETVSCKVDKSIKTNGCEPSTWLKAIVKHLNNPNIKISYITLKSNTEN